LGDFVAYGAVQSFSKIFGRYMQIAQFHVIVASGYRGPIR